MLDIVSKTTRQLAHDILLAVISLLREERDPQTAIDSLMLLVKQMESEGAAPKPYLLDICKDKE